MKYPVRIVPAVLCLFLFLTFPSCGEKPGEKETSPDTAAPASEPDSRRYGTESESETEPESEPAAAKDRMKKLVREESEALQAELQAEKETDPIFDETREPDPAQKAELQELRQKKRALAYELEEIDEYEDPEGWDSLAREIEALDLRIEELALLTLPAGYSRTREDAKKDYASYAYFRKPGHPFSHFTSAAHRVLIFDSIEILASRAYPYLPDLAPTEAEQVAFAAKGIGLEAIGENSFAVVMEVTEVYWGDLSAGDRIAFAVDGEENAASVRDAAGWLLFVRKGDGQVESGGAELPLFHAWSEQGYEILTDGSLLSCTRLGEFHKLEGLTPEEACRLVLRTFLKYGDLRGKGAKLAIESPAG